MKKCRPGGFKAAFATEEYVKSIVKKWWPELRYYYRCPYDNHYHTTSMTYGEFRRSVESKIIESTKETFQQIHFGKRQRLSKTK